MAYAGRVIGPLPSVMSHMENKEWLFKDSSLVKLRRTLGEPKQIPAKNMIQMETVGGNALPDAAITNTHGAQKFAQLGETVLPRSSALPLTLRLLKEWIIICFLECLLFIKSYVIMPSPQTKDDKSQTKHE